VATVPISVKSQLPAETGGVYVIYRDGKYSAAEVSGEFSAAVDGEVARLYAQRFPFTSAPAAVSSVIVHPAAGTARYAFQVTPTLATRYQVKLFRNGASAEPVATSAVKTVYVDLHVSLPQPQKCNSGPVCYMSVAANILSPPSTLRAEMSKTPSIYFGLSLAKTRKAPAPKWLSLGAGHSLVAGTEQVSADEFRMTVTFSFTHGSDHYIDFAWNICLKDAEAEDGIGLPGHHGCGDPRVLFSATYLG
jgi:hypothetical protein